MALPRQILLGYVTKTTKSTSIVVTIDRIDVAGNIVGPPVMPSLTLSDITTARRGEEVPATFALTSNLYRPYDLVFLAMPGQVTTSFSFVSNKQTLLYCITYSSADPAKRDHVFRTFQNEVHTHFPSKPGTVNIHSFTQAGGKWSSGIDYDSLVWTAAKVKSA